MSVACCNSAKCVEKIGDTPDAYLHLFPLLRLAPPHVHELLKLLSSLASRPKLVAHCLSHGALVHLLYLFASAQVLVTRTFSADDGTAATTTDAAAAEAAEAPQLRAQLASGEMTKIVWSDELRAAAGGVLCRLSCDRAHTAEVQALVSRTMPLVFLQTMVEDAARTVAIFDASHENPELIWNASMRSELRTSLEHSSKEVLLHQRASPMTPFSIPDDFSVVYPQLKDLRCIGGVYLGQLLAQPAWQLRDPRAFLEALLAEWVRLVDLAASTDLEEASRALVVLLQANPSLSAHVAAMGYLSKIIAAVPSERADLQKAAVEALRVLTDAPEVVHALRSVDCVRPMLQAMKESPSTTQLLLPSLTSMASAPEIVEKAHEAQLVPFVLELLRGGLELCDDPSAVKAHAVKLLKTLAADARLGPTIQQALDADHEWENYKAQEHDLFLAPNGAGGLITNTGGGRVGLLT